MNCYCSSPPPSPSSQLIGAPVASFDIARDEVRLKLSGQGLMPANKELGRELESGGVCMSSFEIPGGCSREGVFSPLFGIAAARADSYYNSGTGGLNMIEYDPLAALQKFLPSNNYNGNDDEEDNRPVDSWSPMDLCSCDDFRMYEFKVRRCMIGKSHDWTDCPFAHPGEKARRRDPRRFHYSGMACPEFRRGSCKRGEECEYAHGVFECWLHPARYRTQPCKDGRNCRRRVCFFAHTVDQLRILSGGGSGGGVCVRSCAEVAALPYSPAALVGSPRLNGLKVALSPCVAYNGIEAGAEVATPPSSPVARGGSAISSGVKVEMRSSAAFYDKSSRHQALPGSPAVELPEQLLDCYCRSSSPPVCPDSLLPSSPSFPSQQLHSLPSFAIPATSDRNLDVALSPSRLHSCRTRTELLSALQQLQLKAYAVEASRATSSPRSIGQPWLQLHHSSRSVPKIFTTPTYANQMEKWVGNESEVKPETRRVEAGRFLNPSKTCGRIGSQNTTETDPPDFGWVNELVK